MREIALPARDIGFKSRSLPNGPGGITCMFGSRRGADDSEVVSAIALVLNSPANLLFLL